MAVKFVKLFSFLFIGFVILNSCKDSESDKPEIVEGISFNIDGTPLILEIDDLDNDIPQALFQLKEPNFTNNENTSRLLIIRARNETSILSINLEVNVADSDSCIPEKEYNNLSLSSAEGILSIDFSNENGIYLHTRERLTTILEITKCDFENEIISGNFKTFLSSTDSLETIELSEGSFENVSLKII